MFDMLAELEEDPIEKEPTPQADIMQTLEILEITEGLIDPEEYGVPEPEEDLSEEDEETIIPQELEELVASVLPPEAEDAPRKKKKGLRAEWIMGIIALLAAVLLGVMVLICLPYMTAEEVPKTRPPVILEEEDPEIFHHQEENGILEPTVPEEEPENPTIPPEKNPYDRFDFQYNRNNYLLLQNLKSYPGVDVSAYQGNIDWKKVKQSGIDFAIIRLGYRGYESGKLVEDTYAVQNLNGARAAGLKVGAYFFSQALTVKEADEEIAFMMKVLNGFLPDMPLILDWEIPTADARTAKMNARTLTDIQKHYCEVITQKGYTPMVYFNWHQSEHLYYLSELEDYPFWLALYQDRMTYPWKVEMWQYTDKGSVPGISGPVDLNVYMP